MLRRFIAVIGALFLTTSAWADGTIDTLTNATSLTGTENVPIFQTANPAVKTTTQAIANLKAAVTSIATSCGAAGGTITSTGTIKVSETTNAQTGTSYTTQASDCGKLVTQSNVSASAITLLAPATAGAGFWHDFTNIGAGTATLTPASGTINGNATLVLTTGQGAHIVTDGSNYFAVLGQASSGGGSLTVTDGTHSVTSTTTLTVGNGFVVSGSAGSATVNSTFTDATKTTSYTAAAGDMGNGLTLAATTGTPALTLPAASSSIFAPGMTLTVSVPKITSGVNWTLTNSTGLTLRGLSSTTLLPGTQGTFVANADGVTLDFFPGAQVATTTALGSVMPDGTTITITNGVISSTGGGSGCTVSGTQFQILAVNGAGTGCTNDPNATVNSGTLTLGNSGIQGSVVLNGSVSGTTTLVPTSAAGSTTATLPANTGTVAELNLAQTWSAAQSFNSSDLKLNGSTSGTITLNAAGTAGTNTITLPAVTDTVAVLGTSQSFTAGQAVTPDSATSCGTQSAGGTMTPNFANSNSCLATFGAGNLTIANPSNVKAGQPYVIALTQDATGSRTVTWGSEYKFPGGVKPTLSTAASAKDIISCWADTTTTINCTLAVANAS